VLRAGDTLALVVRREDMNAAVALLTGAKAPDADADPDEASTPPQPASGAAS